MQRISVGESPFETWSRLIENGGGNVYTASGPGGNEAVVYEDGR